MIRWFTRNDIAANFLLVAILLGGIFTAYNKITLEVNPSEEYPEVDIKMVYRGGSPKDVEEHIIVPIERVLKEVQGIKSIRARASRGAANFDITPEKGVDLDELKDEVEARVNQINTFPGETERPRIAVPHTSDWREVVTVAVTGDLGELELYRLARRVEEDILNLSPVSRTDMRGEHPLEIAIEADDEKLRDHGLTIQDLGNAVRRSSVALSAGSVRTSAGSFMIRSDGQAYNLEDFGNIVVTSANGAELKISDLATLSDGFETKENILRFNGKKPSSLMFSKHLAKARSKFPMPSKLTSRNQPPASPWG